MTDEGKPLQPEQMFKRVAWRGVVALGAGLEQSTTWTITGVAAIVALFVGHLDSVSKIVTPAGMRWSLILFASSILAGAVSKQLGMAVQSGIRAITDLEALLASEAGSNLMDAMTIEPRQLVTEVAAPFVWPMSTLTRRSGEKGLTDYLSSDKRFVRLFCWQIYFNVLHALLAVAAIVELAVSFNVK